MRIIVPGGAGDMGSRVVEDLATHKDVDRITIADRNTDAAAKLAAKLKGRGANVDVSRIDANNHDGLVAAMRGYDVVASALGPFHLYEAKMVRAAIEAGVDYASICDEWQAADEVINEFSDEARTKGRTIITGLGASPGISNIGVRYLVRQLDKTRRVDIYIFQPLDAGGGEAVLRHMMFIMSGDVATWRGGKRVMIPACSEEREAEFPRFGRIKLWNMGHAEPVTVPHFIPGIEEVNFFMGFGRGAGLVVKPAQWGLFNGKRRSEAIVRILTAIERLTAGEPGWGAIRIDAWGELDGKEAHRLVCGIGQMREATGLSLSIGAIMLGAKEILTEEGGVYAPEACFDPVKFITRLKAKGIQAFEDLDMTRPIG